MSRMSEKCVSCRLTYILAQRPSNKLGGGFAEFIDYDFHFKQCLHLVKFVDDYTFKCLNWLVGVLGIERLWIVT